MEKILGLLLAVSLMVSFAGCNDNKKKDDKTSSVKVEQKAEERAKKEAEENNIKIESEVVSDEQTTVSNEQTFETDNGIIRILGAEKADPNVVDEENAYVVKFEVTNKSDEPREGYEVFYWDIYQNNVEVTEINSYTDTGSDHAALLGNRYKGIMNGGTLIVGAPVVLQDTSALTVFLRDGLDLDNKTDLTINIE